MNLLLNKEEFLRLGKLVSNLRFWSIEEMRMFPGRPNPARKAIQDIGIVPMDEIHAYSSLFVKFSESYKNKLDAAKDFRVIKSLPFTSLNTKELRWLPLRAFNTVIFAEHFQSKE